MSRPYFVVVALLLLAEVSSFGEETSNPGVVVRITRKRPGICMTIHRFELRYSELKLLPQEGVRVILFNNFVSLSGMWNVKKAFISLTGSFNMSVDGMVTSVSLNLGKDRFGRPTASVTHCSNTIGEVSTDISGSLSWIMNLFKERIENNLKNMLQQQICELFKTAAISELQPYLRTLPVTWMIDEVAGIDYRMVGAPIASSEGLDTPFKGEFFNRSQHSPVPFDAPAIMLPLKRDRMVYFAVSAYVFNTASWVYFRNKHMNFIIRNEHLMNLAKLSKHHLAQKGQEEHSNPSCLTQANSPLTALSCISSSFLLLMLQIPPESPITLHTNSFQVLIPKLASLYPNVEMELEVSPESAPILIFAPGNVTLMAVMDVQAFALPPTSADHVLLFQLRAKANISVTIDVRSSRIFGFVTTGSPLKLELKRSKVDSFNVQPLESILNYYAQHTIYPFLNAKLEQGLPLPLPRDTHLNSLALQIHENFLLLGANID